MNLIGKSVYVSIERNNELFDEVVACFDSAAIETKSCTGLEIATFVINIVELIVLIVSVPTIQKTFEAGQIKVTIFGISFNDSVSNIVEELKKTPELLEKAKDAYNNGELCIEGSAKASLQFLQELEKIISEITNTK